MENLITILKKHQIESDSLEVLFPSAQETSYILACEGATAFSRWRQLRSLMSQTGYWPVILGPQFELESVRQNVASIQFDGWYGSRSIKEILEESQTIDVARWVKEGDVERALEGYAQERERLTQQGVDVEEDPWIRDPLEDFLQELSGMVFLALCPTNNCWEVPAFFRFGDFNECPQPSTHASVMRYWSEKYGMDLVMMSRCDWLAFVAHPPQERADALVLALEHIEYCPEFIAEKWEGNIEALASWLLHASYWSFWWD